MRVDTGREAARMSVEELRTIASDFSAYSALLQIDPKPGDLAAAVTDLIDNEKVVAVFGPTNSGNAMAWKHIANQKKVPVIGNVGSGTAITAPMGSGDNYMFRVSMVDREQVAALMAYVKKNAATSKVVGLMAETTGYGQGGLKDMEEIVKLHGLAPLLIQVGEDEILRNDSLRFADKAKAAGVDVRLQRYPDLWHVFQAHAGMLKAADFALAEVVSFLRQRGC